MLGFGIPGMMAAVGGSGGGGGLNQLTGDVTAGPGTGSQAATLATVNSNVGTFGNGTTIPVVTVNGKGLVTAVSTAAVSGGGGGPLGMDTFRAETLDPADAQWPNGTNAPIGSSVGTTSVQVAQYTADSMARGEVILVPAGVTNAKFEFVYQASAANGGTNNKVRWRFAQRALGSSGAATNFDFTDQTVANNTNFATYSQTVAIASLSLTAGASFQFQLVRIMTGVTNGMTQGAYLKLVRITWT